MNPGDIVELTENFAVYPERKPRRVFTAGTQFVVKHLIPSTGWVKVQDQGGSTHQIPASKLEVVQKAGALS